VRLLSRYICGQFLRFFALGFGVCTGIFLIVELFDRIDDFIALQALWSDAVLYLLFKLPEIGAQLLPAAFLLASVLTFSTLTKYNEITAVRAGGIAPLRLARPLFVLGGLGCLVLLIAYEYLLPYTNQAYRLIWRTRIRHETLEVPPGMVQGGQIWYRAGPRLWSIELGKPLEQRLLGVTIYELDATGSVRQRYDVAEAGWGPQGWVLRQGTVRVFTADGAFAGPPEHFVERQGDFPEQLADILALRKAPDEMSLREIFASMQRLRRKGFSEASYTVEFHGKLAFAAVCIIMAGFGVPLALRLNRSGGTMQAISVTLFCGFAYWILYSLATGMGKSGQLPPVLAAWVTNCCFGVGSVYLSYRLQ
jgi:lipopolysaccharide export system permease protein